MSDEFTEGGCHCGAVRFRVRGKPDHLVVCNCSICTKKGYLHWFVARDDFELLTPEDAVSTYTFGTHTAKHYFCKTCGIASFYVARSHPDSIDVNARCCDGLQLDALPVETFDGQDWEAGYEGYRNRPD